MSDRADSWLLRSVSVPLRWEDSAPRSSPTTVAALAARLPMEATVRLCSALQMFLYSLPGLDNAGHRQLQLGLTAALFPPLLGDPARDRLLREPNLVVFHEEQLLYLIYLALGWSQETTDRHTPPVTLAELLLRINDLLAPTSSAAIPDVLLRIALRQAVVIPQEQPIAAIARQYDLLFRRSGAEDGRRLDLRAAFLAQVGVSLETYLWLVSSYTAFFLDVQTPAQLRQREFDRVIQRINSLLAGDHRAPAACRLFTGTPAWYRKVFEIGALPVNPQQVNYEPLHERPFIELPSGTILPAAPGLGLLRMSRGLYWTLFAHYQERGDRERHAFTSSVGLRFQQYISDAIRASAPAASNSHVILEDDLTGARKSAPTPDVVVTRGSDWVIFEVTSQAITMATQVRGDVASFREELQEKFSDKLRQPLEGLRSLLTGRVAHPGLDPTAVDHVFPVLVTLDPLPLPPGMERDLDEEYVRPLHASVLGDRSTVIHSVHILSAEEVEMMLPVLQDGVSVSELLRRWEADVPRRSVSMKNYLIYTQYAAISRNRWLEGMFGAVRDASRLGAPQRADK